VINKECRKCGIKLTIFNTNLSWVKCYNWTCKKCWGQYHRAYQIRKNYNISVEEYDKLLKNRNNKCNVCGKIRKLMLDHNHQTGEIRNFVCRPCNSHIAWFENYKSKIMKHLGD